MTTAARVVFLIACALLTDTAITASNERFRSQQTNEWTPEALVVLRHCEMVYGGANARMHGVNAGKEKPIFKWVSAAEMKAIFEEANRTDWPKNFIAVKLDDEDAAAKAVLESSVSLGWHIQDEFMRANSDATIDPSFVKRKCLRDAFNGKDT